MRSGKNTQDPLSRHDPRQLVCRGSVRAPGHRAQPRLNQILCGGLPITAKVGALKLRSTATQNHIEPATDSKVRQLMRHVSATLRPIRRKHVSIALPIPLGRIRIYRSRRGVSKPRGRDYTHRRASFLGHYTERFQWIGERLLAIAAARLRTDIDHTRPRLPAGHQRRGRAGGVGYLLVGVVGLDQRDVGKRLKDQLVFLSGHALRLPVEDSGCGHSRDAHAVANKENHVSCACNRTLRLLGSYRNFTSPQRRRERESSNQTESPANRIHGYHRAA